MGKLIMEITAIDRGPPSPLQVISVDLLEWYQYVETRYLAILNIDKSTDQGAPNDEQ